MALWHILSRGEWEAAREAGEYRPESLRTEGFIHLSEDKQWLRVANARYAGQTDLVLLSIRADRLKSPVHTEPADGDAYPHLYGPLNLDAVVDVFPLPCSPDGRIELPEALRPWRLYFVDSIDA